MRGYENNDKTVKSKNKWWIEELTEYGNSFSYLAIDVPKSNRLCFIWNSYTNSQQGKETHVANEWRLSASISGFHSLREQYYIDRISTISCTSTFNPPVSSKNHVASKSLLSTSIIHLFHRRYRVAYRNIHRSTTKAQHPIHVRQFSFISLTTNKQKSLIIIS